MTVWAPIIVPACSGLVGVLVGGYITVRTQKIASEASYWLEAHARQDAFIVKAYELEREALIELQDVLSEHFQMFLKRLKATEGLPSESSDRFLEFDVKIMAFSYRVADPRIGSAAGKYIIAAREALTPSQPAPHEAATDAMLAALKIISGAVTRDPFVVEAKPPERGYLRNLGRALRGRPSLSLFEALQDRSRDTYLRRIGLGHWAARLPDSPRVTDRLGGR